MAMAQAPPSQTDITIGQVQIAVQRAIALRQAQLAVHTMIAAAADPLVPDASLPTFTNNVMVPPNAIVLPPVPTIGVSPIATWLMSVASAVLIFTLPTLMVFVKQHFAMQAAMANSAMIDKAVAHAAARYMDHKDAGVPDDAAISSALTYVKNSTDAVKKTPQATDLHLTNMIKAEASQQVRGAQPVIVNTPVHVAQTPPTPQSFTTPPLFTGKDAVNVQPGTARSADVPAFITRGANAPPAPGPSTNKG